jgi:hypothetical protein
MQEGTQLHRAATENSRESFLAGQSIVVAGGIAAARLTRLRRASSVRVRGCLRRHGCAILSAATERSSAASNSSTDRP